MLLLPDIMSFIQMILSFVFKWFPYGSKLVSWLWFPYTSVSALISRRQPNRVFACGLLTSTGTANSDRCQAMEFVAIRALLNCADGQSFWLCGTDIRSGTGFLLGDPACNHILYNPPPFEEIYDTSGPNVHYKLGRLLGAYLRRVTETALRLTSGDVLCLVLCGHGLPNGKLVIGDGKTSKVTLGKGLLEAAVRTCKPDVHLLITSSYGGSWTSPYWRLLAAAPNDVNPETICDSLSGSPQADLAVSTELSDEEEQDLLWLSEDHNKFLPPYSLSEAILARNCAILTNPNHKPPLTIKEKIRTLKSLQLRSTYRCLSLVIAHKLGWEKAVEEVGLPFEEQRRLGPNIPLQLRAVENGYDLVMLYAHRYNNSPWVGAGGWLARVWQTAGEPTIRPADWDIVLRESCHDVGLDPL